MALDALLDQHTRHVADRSGFLLGQFRKSRAQILRQDHLNPGGFRLAAG